MSSHPDTSMEALMDAVARVSSSPRTSRSMPPFAHSHSSQPTSLFPGLSGLLSPHPVPSHPFSMSGGIMAPIRSPLNGMGGLLANQEKLGPLRKRNHDSALARASAAGFAKKARIDADGGEDKKSKRLEQNRLAAVESRRRKKHMVEELHRSVQFFSKANMTLKSQNAELERQLLIAKEKVLRNEEKKAKADTQDASAKVKASSLDTKPDVTDIKPAVKPSARSAIDNDIISYPSLFGHSRNAEMESQAKEAQFAATLALYQSMGYPAGAARAAASALSQYSDESSNIALKSSPGKNEKVAAPAQQLVKAANAIHQASSSALVLTDKKTPPGLPSDESAYIQALNRYAMQQAAAASAAAVAANAAIQAARLHQQLRNGLGTAPSSSHDTSSFPFTLPNPIPKFAGLPSSIFEMPISKFPIPSGLAWNYQDTAPAASRD